jgi:hypothetical protein
MITAELLFPLKPGALPGGYIGLTFNQGDPSMTSQNQNPGQQNQNPGQKPGQQQGGGKKPGQQQQDPGRQGQNPSQSPNQNPGQDR